jgi:ribosomal protein RSM22 (predicted rRNA methylase)
LLDVGAGPGVAAWAALEAWPSLNELTLVEVEPAMVAAGSELLPDATWVAGEVSGARGPADLVLASYVLGELDDAGSAAAALWEQSADTAVFVEPGTPVGYGNVLAARAAALDRGAYTLAPCPHDRPCPLPAGDWCHFAVRLPRSKLHRLAKGADLGWEDEKFSYAVLVREPLAPAPARIIRQPQIRSGHVNLVTCEPDGVHERTVSRREGALYREARKAAWGDAIALAPEPRP